MLFRQGPRARWSTSATHRPDGLSAASLSSCPVIRLLAHWVGSRIPCVGFAIHAADPQFAQTFCSGCGASLRALRASDEAGRACQVSPSPDRGELRIEYFPSVLRLSAPRSSALCPHYCSPVGACSRADPDLGKWSVYPDPAGPAARARARGRLNEKQVGSLQTIMLPTGQSAAAVLTQSDC